MSVLSGLRFYAAIGAAVILAMLVAWLFRLDHLRAGWQDRYEALTAQASEVLNATRVASDNPDLSWKNTAAQVAYLGDSRRLLRVEIETQTAKIDEMARDAVRLKAEAAELQRIADKARAQRKSALDQLSRAAITPGTRDDCMTLLREAEDALDLVYEAGL